MLCEEPLYEENVIQIQQVRCNEHNANSDGVGTLPITG